jgi:HEAT repeat protein
VEISVGSGAAAASSAGPWSNSLSQWEAAIAREAGPVVATPPALPPAEPLGPWETAIRGLLGLIAFLIALIGVVLAGRQLRPLFAPTGGNAGAAPLVHQLQSGKGKPQRLEAARKLVALGPPAVAAALDASTEASDDGQTLKLSRQAIDALAECGPDAAPALAAALAAPKAGIRAGAASVLVELGPRGAAAKTALVAALADRNRWVRWYAIEALGNMGPEAAAAGDALLPLLTHDDAYTRRRAAEALGRIGKFDQKTIDALTKRRDEDHDASVRQAANVALNQLDLPNSAAHALEQAPDDVRELAKKLQTGDEFAAVAAAKDLGALGLRAGDAAGSLALALRHKNKWVREAAAVALGKLDGQARDVRPSLQAATHDAEPEVRAAATRALELIEGK